MSYSITPIGCAGGGDNVAIVMVVMMMVGGYKAQTWLNDEQ